MGKYAAKLTGNLAECNGAQRGGESFKNFANKSNLVTFGYLEFEKQ